MGKFFKWGAIAISIVLVVGISAIFVTKILFSNKGTTEKVQDKPTPEQQAIIDEKFEKKETINKADLDSKNEVYDMMHEMANTKIIAEDGLIWGLQPITADRIEAVKKALKDLKIEDPKLSEILDRWAQKDFSQCVDDHNYIWEKYLHGEIGKAKALRK